jgi:cytochrome oxidase Cu insertion factor (SCO1/SenC/PrrC family)
MTAEHRKEADALNVVRIPVDPQRDTPRQLTLHMS